MRFKSPQGNNDQGPFKSQSALLLSAGLARVAVYLAIPYCTPCKYCAQLSTLRSEISLASKTFGLCGVSRNNEICNRESIPF